MGTFINSINNIVKLPSTISQNRRVALISQSIQNGIIDTVNFSDQAKNLFDISSIDKQFDGIFGLPNELSPSQQQELQTIQKSLDTLFTTSNTNFQTLDFDKTYDDLVNNLLKDQEISPAEQTQLKDLSTELKNYMAELSLNQLTGSQGSTLSQLTQGFNAIFPAQISDEESQKFATLSLQLNRLFFTNEDSQTSSFLDQFNSLYGLNSPDKETLNQAVNLFSQRNTLLSSLLANTNFNTTYSNLL